MRSFKASNGPNIVERGRVADQIFMDMRNSIVLGSLPHGSKLPTERELALHYQVSSPTVREAIRGLSLIGLVDVRHGSGAYVTADTGSLIALSLATVIQMSTLGVSDVLSVLGVLNAHAARLAAEAATEEDLDRLQDALKLLDEAGTSEAACEAVRNFHSALASAAHNPLLMALCGFLADLQTELGLELTGDSIALWNQIFDRLRPIRLRLVEAIKARDPEGAAELSRSFHALAVDQITSLPKAKEVRLNDPKLRQLLSSMMARVGRN
jgi:GntR family transcriptional repressor for pyruvate dehydrogenase complex